MESGSLAALIAVLGMLAVPAQAMNEDRFLIRTTGDLARLCGVPPTDRHHEEAIHMCEGYFVGAHQLHSAIMARSETGGIYCIPKKGAPTRNQAVAEFVRWVNGTPKAARLPAIEGFMRWAASRFPCS